MKTIYDYPPESFLTSRDRHLIKQCKISNDIGNTKAKNLEVSKCLGYTASLNMAHLMAFNDLVVNRLQELLPDIVDIHKLKSDGSLTRFGNYHVIPELKAIIDKNPDVYKDFALMRNDLSIPTEPIKYMLKGCNSPRGVDDKYLSILQKMDHFNAYFDYADGSDTLPHTYFFKMVYSVPKNTHTCKPQLVDVANAIGAKAIQAQEELQIQAQEEALQAQEEAALAQAQEEEAQALAQAQEEEAQALAQEAAAQALAQEEAQVQAHAQIMAQAMAQAMTEVMAQAQEAPQVQAQEASQVQALEEAQALAQEAAELQAQAEAQQQEANAELRAQVQQLQASLVQRDNVIGKQNEREREKDSIIGSQAAQIENLNQDKSDMREDVVNLRKSNLEKSVRIEDANEVIDKKDEQLQEKDDVIGQKDYVIGRKDGVIDQKNEELEEKDDVIGQQNVELQEKDVQYGLLQERFESIRHSLMRLESSPDSDDNSVHLSGNDASSLVDFDGVLAEA